MEGVKNDTQFPETGPIVASVVSRFAEDIDLYSRNPAMARVVVELAATRALIEYMTALRKCTMGGLK